VNESAVEPTSAPRRRSRFAGLRLILGGLALLLLAGGLTLGARGVILVTTQSPANATVVGVISTQSGQGMAYITTFEFTVGDNTYEIKSVPQGTRSTYRAGQVVPVRYDPANPSHAQLAGFRELWLGPLGLIVLGLALGGVGVALFGNPFTGRRNAA
jgi:hypothetical protein